MNFALTAIVLFLAIATLPVWAAVAAHKSAPTDLGDPEMPHDVDQPEPFSCPHESVDHEPADPAVGIMCKSYWCAHCGAELDPTDFERDYEGELADLYGRDEW